MTAHIDRHLLQEVCWMPERQGQQTTAWWTDVSVSVHGSLGHQIFPLVSSSHVDTGWVVLEHKKAFEVEEVTVCTVLLRGLLEVVALEEVGCKAGPLGACWV